MKTYSFEEGKYEFDRDDLGMVVEARRNGERSPVLLDMVAYAKFFQATLNHVDQLELRVQELEASKGAALRTGRWTDEHA